MITPHVTRTCAKKHGNGPKDSPKDSQQGLSSFLRCGQCCRSCSAAGEKKTSYCSGPTGRQPVRLKASTRRCPSRTFLQLQREPFGVLGSGEEYPNKCPLVSMPASLSSPPWTRRLQKIKIKILYIYIYIKCRYFYIFCMVTLKKKFLCIFYIYTDLLNLIIGNRLKEF